MSAYLCHDILQFQAIVVSDFLRVLRRHDRYQPGVSSHLEDLALELAACF